MIKLTRQDPQDRFNSIEENANDIRGNTYWQNFAIPILAKFEVEGKVLTPVTLVYANVCLPTPPHPFFQHTLIIFHSIP
jgi:hypothetical protein